MESKELSIIIVTFKSEGKISNCLNSIPADIKVKIIENSDNKNFKQEIEECLVIKIQALVAKLSKTANE